MQTIEIDGSQGEGGGQIIRSSCALSAVTGKPFTISNIRAGRAKPGLKPQHVVSVNAAREVCGGGIDGAELGSSRLSFFPGPVQARDFHFVINSAGSTTLVAQTVLPALMMAEGPSSITVDGGTHNMGAPPFDFLDRVYLSQVAQMGPTFSAKLTRHGFFPVGGGQFRIDITPAARLRGLNLVERESPPRAAITALVSKLPIEIAEREASVIRRKGRWQPGQATAVEVTDSPGPGNVVMVELDCGNVRELVTGFGKRGVKAEQVARGVYREAKAYLDRDVPVGEHLADQLLLPMGLAASRGASSSFITGPLSLHTTTHIDILRLFLDITITTEEIAADTWQLTIARAPRDR